MLTAQSPQASTFVADLAELVQEFPMQAHDRVRSILRDPYASVEVASLRDYYRAIIGSVSTAEEVKGSIGFLLFSRVVEAVRWVSDDAEYQYRALADEILNDGVTYAFIREQYNLENARVTNVEEVRYHKTGTTSIILRVRPAGSNELFALKILKYHYLDTESITSATSLYRQTYEKGLAYVPTIFDSAPTHIVMRFVDGYTLQEYTNREIGDSRSKDTFIQHFIPQLCGMLRDLANRGLVHGDLSPKNIIIHRPKGPGTPVNETEVYLIDFGVNYLLSEKVGSSSELGRATLFVAPEVLDNPSNVSVLSDVYSMGAIMLSLLTEGDLEFRAFDSYLDDVRLEDPGLAAILDEILEKDPALRAFDLQTDPAYSIPGSALIYQALQRDIELEFGLRRVRENLRGGQNWVIAFLLDILEFATADFAALVRRRLEEAKILVVAFPSRAVKYRFRTYTRGAGAWSVVASLAHLSVVVTFLVMGKRYADQGELTAFLGLRDSAFVGLVACLSFSFVAVRYYLHLCSNLYAKDLGRLGVLTHTWLRFCTLYWAPVLCALFVFAPHLWPFACAFGTWVVAMNNLLCYQLGVRARKEIENTLSGHIPKAVEERLQDFRGWSELMFAYSTAFLVVGYLLVYNEQLHDEYAYFFMTLVINWKLWRYNCGREAAIVQKTLNFLFFRYRRARQYRTVQGRSVEATSRA